MGIRSPLPASLLISNVIIIAFVHISYTCAGSYVTSSQMSQKLKFLGIADGKSYFSQNAPERTWEEAKEYCKSFDLELATIESENQAELLNKTLTGGYNFWTSAKELESRQPSNLTWHGNQEQLNASLLPSWYWKVSEYHLCATVKVITLSTNYNTKKRFEMDVNSCSSRAYTLCQCPFPGGKIK